jgi:hypothetical protein
MPSVPQSTKTSLTQSLQAHAGEHWPQLADLRVRFRGQFAYVEAELADGEVLPLCRLRYLGSTDVWGFGLYLASSDKYEDQTLSTGSFTGTATDALDCACNLYLAGPTF